MGTVGRRDAAVERTRTYSQRVPVRRHPLTTIRMRWSRSMGEGATANRE